MSTDLITHIYADGGCAAILAQAVGGSHACKAGTAEELWGGEPDTTNNRMELTAVIRALEALKRPALVHIHTSTSERHQPVDPQLEKTWKTADKKPVKNAGPGNSGRGQPTPQSHLALGQGTCRAPR